VTSAAQRSGERMQSTKLSLNQQTAHEVLSQYRAAKLEISYLRDKITTMQGQVESCTANYARLTQCIGYDNHGDPIMEPISVMGNSGKGAEDLLDSLIDAREYYRQRLADNTRLLLDLERSIDQRCPGINGLILKHYYFDNVKLEFIPIKLGCYD
jgi:hypothetical protein